MLEIKRRTFEAAKHPKGSEERARLNCNSLTSEYMTSYRYVIVEDGKTIPFSYRTRGEAQAYIDRKAQEASR